jgi:GTPase
MIRGNMEGIKKVYIKELEEIFELDCDKNIIISREILDIICRISSKVNKEISMYINRRGTIIDISLGDNATVNLEDLTEKRSEMGLNGLRCIHTHPGGESMLSSVDVTALISMKFDCMVAISIDNEMPDKFSFGYLKVENGKILEEVFIEGPYLIDEMQDINFMEMIEDMEGQIYNFSHEIQDDNMERVLLVGGLTSDLYSVKESLDELQELAETAGAKVIDRVVQSKRKPDSALYIGSGKASEISLLKQSLMINTVIFDDELSGAQVKNLENIIGCKVIDRTSLILDIFAQRAKSKEGKIQVELAQLKYAMPRLIGLGRTLSRTGGGIGTRGPGEKKLEIDRRLIRKRVLELTKELENIKKTRTTQRERRISNEVPVVSLAGYTNAGKSTLRNMICEIAGVDKEKVFEADILFATLDTTTRLAMLPSGKEALFSDTVGFIRKLPHDLVDAFKSTLEEVLYSNVIIHVADASNSNVLAQIETVNKVLSEIGAGDKEVILVLNKIDIASEENISIIRGKYNEALEISAKYNTNLNLLLDRVQEILLQDFISANLLIPYSDAKMLSYLHDNRCVDKEEYRDNGIYVEITTTQDIFGRIRNYII